MCISCLFHAFHMLLLLYPPWFRHNNNIRNMFNHPWIHRNWPSWPNCSEFIIMVLSSLSQQFLKPCSSQIYWIIYIPLCFIESQSASELNDRLQDRLHIAEEFFMTSWQIRSVCSAIWHRKFHSYCYWDSKNLSSMKYRWINY